VPRPRGAPLSAHGVDAVGQSSFLLVANGSAETPPASAVLRFLVDSGSEVTTIFHPLNAEDAGVHAVARWAGGRQVLERRLRLPSKPPYTYPLDALAPLLRPKVDGWIGFSNLSAADGVLRRRLGLVRRVAYWAVDFVPDRFGAGSALTHAYDAVDRFASKRVDLRVELTALARDERSARLRLGVDAAPTHIAPIGIWLDRMPRAPEDAWRLRKVVFAGHLVPRQGVATLVEAIALVPDVALEITGRGPEEPALRALVAERGIADRVLFHGFLDDHRDVERVVASASVAVAPYATDPDSFTRFADPSKLRMYAAAGLPMVITDVPPNARELERVAGATVVDYEPRAVAAAIAAILASPDDWRRRRQAALAYAEGYDWARIVPAALERLGFAV